MLQDPIFIALLPQMQEALRFLLTSVSAGILGNRADAAFKRLFPHQKQNLAEWMREYNPSPDELRDALQKPDNHRLFSILFDAILNERFHGKLKYWAKACDSIVRNKPMSIERKEYFIHLLTIQADFTIDFLANLYRNRIPRDEVMPIQFGEAIPTGTQKEAYYISYLQTYMAGLVSVISENNNRDNFVVLTDLGREFVDFVSDKYFDSE